MQSFVDTHNYLIENLVVPLRRKLMDEIDWNHRLIGIKGTRGIGNRITSYNVCYTKLLRLQALLYSMRITNPARGMKYSVLSNLKLDEAQEVNASNPRIYYCRGNNLYFTPSFFGGGKDKALVQFRIAEKLYLKHISISDLTPSWDFKHNQEMIKKCLKN